MFQELMNIVRQFGQSAVVENPAVPNEHNEAVMQEAGHSIFSALQQRAQNGDTEGLSGLLRGDETHPAVTQVKNNFADNIAQKFGIGGTTAAGLAGSLIPAVLQRILQRPANGNSGGFSLGSLIASLTGGNAAGNPGMLSGLGARLGLDRDGDGDVDLADLGRLVHP